MRRKTLALTLVLLPLASAAATFGVRSAWDRGAEKLPALECPSSIDLGDRDLGEIAVGRFMVKNAGRAPLKLDNFQTSCSCAGIEHEVEGQLRRVQSVELLPGERVELTARVAVGAKPGQRQLVQAFFRTNDPARPTAGLEILIPRVKGGVYAEPAAVVFGTAGVGERLTRVIDLYDNAVQGRRIAAVRSTHPERFAVRQVPLTDVEARQVHEQGGRLIARLEVTARTERPGPLKGDIEVRLADESRRPDLISVAGAVSRGVECWPGALVLPRRVGDRFLYSGQVLVADPDGKPIRVEVEELPPGASAKVGPVAGRADQVLLQVDCKPMAKGVVGETVAAPVRLRVRAGGKETEVEVPLILTEDPS